MQQQVRILNRLPTWTKNVIEYEADQRHAKIIIKQFGFTASKPVGTPAVIGNAQGAKARSSKPHSLARTQQLTGDCRQGQTTLLKIVLISSLQPEVRPSA